MYFWVGYTSCVDCKQIRNKTCLTLDRITDQKMINGGCGIRMSWQGSHGWEKSGKTVFRDSQEKLGKVGKFV